MKHSGSVSQKIVFLTTVFYLVFSGLSFGITQKSSDGGFNRDESPESAVSKEGQQPRVVVYYFHGTVRCSTCIKIQVLTVAAVREGFASEIKNGKVQVKVLNIDEEPNRHFEADYSLETKSVVVSQCFGETEKQWKNLEKIWDYVDNEKLFMEYIKTEVKKYL